MGRPADQLVGVGLGDAHKNVQIAGGADKTMIADRVAPTTRYSTSWRLSDLKKPAKFASSLSIRVELPP